MEYKHLERARDNLINAARSRAALILSDTDPRVRKYFLSVGAKPTRRYHRQDHSFRDFNKIDIQRRAYKLDRGRHCWRRWNPGFPW